MAVRQTMAELISLVRDLIQDPAGTEQTFDDQAIQNALDRHKRRHLLLKLTPEGLPQGDGTIQYQGYSANVGFWEAGEILQNGSFALLTAASADRIVGRWTFSESQQPPVFVTGWTYDVYGASADLLETWAAMAKAEYDFSSDGQAFKRSQKAANLLALAQVYRRQQNPTIARVARNDVNVF